MAPALGSRARLLIAPDGDLTRLPFEVLPTADGRCLIDDYQISYLSCGRDVLRFGSATTGQPGGPWLSPTRISTWKPVSGEPEQPKAGFWSRLLSRGKKATATPIQSVPALATTASSAGRHSRDLDRDRRPTISIDCLAPVPRGSGSPPC